VQTRILPGVARISILTLIVIGLGLMLEPGLTFLIIAAFVPYVLVTLVVQRGALRQTEKCVERYLEPER
jgi:hypothetical protein